MPERGIDTRGTRRFSIVAAEVGMMRCPSAGLIQLAVSFVAAGLALSE